MKKAHVWLLCSLCTALPLGAAENPNLHTLLPQAAPHLREEILSFPAWPADLFAQNNPFLFTLSKADTGALAEYDGQSGKILFFRKPLQSWLEHQGASYTAQQLPRALARCAAPLYVHESVHARSHRQGRQNGFSWPFTLEDEYIASFWQIEFILQNLKKDPLYYRACQAFMPAKSLLTPPAAQRERAVYLRYAAFGRHPLPPPMRAAFVAQTAQTTDGSLYFAGRVFRPQKRRLTAPGLFATGRSWLELTPASAKKLPDHPFYKSYIRLLDMQRAETKGIIKKS